MDEKSILMYYHTSLRNVALYTSVSLALLGYSRFYRGKIFIYNISFIVISLMLLAITIYKTQLFSNTLKIQIKELKKEIQSKDKYELKRLSNIPVMMVYLNSIIFLFGIYTLLREIKL